MKITSIIRPMGNGATNPYEIECDDGKRYVAKFPGNPERDRALINEYVCAEIAKKFDLPIPRHELVYIDDIEKYADILDGIELINGTVFCSEKIDKAGPVPSYTALKAVSNSIDALKTLVFDVVVGNNDRNPGNIMINLKNQSFVIIDHSHVFVHGTVWDKNNLHDLIGAPIDTTRLNKVTFNTLIFPNNIASNREIISEYVNNLKLITRYDINKIIENIPDDWTITEEEKEVLENFLIDRINRVKEICRILNIGGE